MSNELAAVVTTYEVELVRAGRMSRDDGPLDERKASDRSQGLQTTSRPEPGSCPTGEHQALHDGTAQRQWRARAIKGSWDCIQGLSDATGDLQAASPAVLLGPGDPTGRRPHAGARSVAELGPSETRAGARPGRPDAHMRGFSARPPEGRRYADRRVRAPIVQSAARTVRFGHLRGNL